jgi:undecaprenyl-diphosphatase
VQHIWAAILGLVQGVTEFLPISSTAHLNLIPWVFNFQGLYPSIANAQFDIALHAGSAVAIIIALWSDWAALVKDAVDRSAPALRFIGFLLLTSIPGAIIGVLFEKPLEKYSTPALFHWAPILVGVMLIAFGVLLWAVDRYTQRTQPLEKMNWLRALLIGLAQAVALIPGVSRSGATMTAGRATGLSREAVAKYSFMAALPIIAGAAVFGLKDVPLSQLFSADWVIGFIAALLSSVVLMRWMLAWVRTHSFSIFMWYRVTLGIAVIALFLFRG